MAISIYGTSFEAADAAVVANFWAEVLGRSVNPGATKESASLAARDARRDGAMSVFEDIHAGRVLGSLRAVGKPSSTPKT